MNPFVEEIRAIYNQHPARCRLQHAPIEPFIGEAFREPSDVDLRVLALGVNAYVDDAEWSKGLPSPSAFATWFEQEKWRFYPRVAKDVAYMADALPRRVPYLAGHRSRRKESAYVTNFVKSYVRTSAGKSEHQLAEEDLASYAAAWAAEIDAMAAHDVLPHLVIVYSRRIWDHVWPAFHHPSEKRALTVHDYRPLMSEPQHRVNRLVVSGASKRRQPLLLLRLRHPSSPDKTASPEWLLSQEAVQKFLELTPEP